MTDLHYRLVAKIFFTLFLNNFYQCKKRRAIVVLYCDMTVYAVATFKSDLYFKFTNIVATFINIMVHPSRTCHDYTAAAATATTPPLPLILTSTCIEQGQLISFVVCGLIARSNHFDRRYLKPPKKMVHHDDPPSYGHTTPHISDQPPPLSAPAASDNSIGPLHGRAWLLVPPTRRTTSTHHPLQFSTKWSMRLCC